MLADLDRSLLVALRTRGHHPWLERGLATYSRTGEHAACWFALGGAGALMARDARARAAWREGAAAVAAAYVLNYAVKVLVRRRRPILEDLPPLTPTVSRLSFPSAHATSSFAAAGAYRRAAPAAAGPLYAAAAVFAVSRPYLGVHFPSDVLAGAALGTAVAALWPAALEALRWR